MPVVTQTGACSLLGLQVKSFRLALPLLNCFQCVRHLALIEMVHKTFTDLPHDHNTLLQELATHRANEESQCQVLGEMQEAAVQRLIAYSKVDDNNFANARFLDLKENVDEGGAAETSLRKIVKDLNDAFEKQGIDMTIFKPNQFAASSVFFTPNSSRN